MAELRKKILLNPVDLLEYILGPEARDYKEQLDSYREECDMLIEVDVILDEENFEITTPKMV